MNILESFSKEGSEIPVNSLETPAYFGETKISEFQNSELLTNRELQNYLSQEIPLSHLENCPSIEYDPDNKEFVNDPYVLAFFTPADHEIKIGPSERSGDTDGFLDTITHEIGHNVHTNLFEEHPDLEKKWSDLHGGVGQALFGDTFVSDYARTSKYEDFAESYRTYVRDPELLQFVSMDKYNFMKEEVFNGKEYQPKN